MANCISKDNRDICQDSTKVSYGKHCIGPGVCYNSMKKMSEDGFKSCITGKEFHHIVGLVLSCNGDCTDIGKYINSIIQDRLEVNIDKIENRIDTILGELSFNSEYVENKIIKALREV